MNPAYIGREFTPVVRGRSIVGYNLGAPLNLDFTRKQHTFIVAKSGSGKSYLAGVVCEELVRTMENYGVVIIDPMGIFSTLKMPNTNVSEFKEWNQQHPCEVVPGTVGNVTVWAPAGDASQFMCGTYDRVFAMRAPEFSYGTLCYAFDLDPLEPQVNLYRKARDLLIKEKGKNYGLGELITFIRDNGTDGLKFQDRTVEALITKLDALAELGIISSDGAAINDVVRDRAVSVFDLSLSSTYTARIIVNFFAEKLLLLRRQITRMVTQARVQETTIEKPTWYIPPVQFVLDEAHNYLPNNPVLQKAVKEGRNCGVMMTAISQSPDLTRDVYANITHLFAGSLVYDDDINGVRSMLPVPITPKEFRERVRGLTPGSFLYYNIDEKTEKRIRVRPRRTMHPASTELVDERRFFSSMGFDTRDVQLIAREMEPERELAVPCENCGDDVDTGECPECQHTYCRSCFLDHYFDRGHTGLSHDLAHYIRERVDELHGRENLNSGYRSYLGILEKCVAMLDQGLVLSAAQLRIVEDDYRRVETSRRVETQKKMRGAA